ncbi:MAG TPA: hypothetical protein V6C86_24090 [Oculatellaceae cyanobacterium]
MSLFSNIKTGVIEDALKSAIKSVNAQDLLTHLEDEFKTEYAAVKASGELPAIEADVKSAVASLKDAFARFESAVKTGK